jgi:hypothetical protein
LNKNFKCENQWNLNMFKLVVSSESYECSIDYLHFPNQKLEISSFEQMVCTLSHMAPTLKVATPVLEYEHAYSYCI